VPPSTPRSWATFTAVVCKLAGTTATSYTCTAEVVGETPNRPTPTGSVSFTAASGTVGASCVLVARAGSAGVASCSVSYTSPTVLTEDAGPPVTADYPGGSVLDATTGDGTVLDASSGTPSDGTSSVLDANIGGSPTEVPDTEDGSTEGIPNDLVNTNPFPVSADEQLTVTGYPAVPNSDTRRAAAAKVQVIGRAVHRIGPFMAVATKINLTRAGAKLLKKHKTLRTELTITTTSAGKPTATKKHTLVIKAKP
jgi:hypothetical protein